MKIIRFVLGNIILFFNFIIPPKKLVNRSLEEQSKVDAQTKNLSIYQFEACPFCVKLRRVVKGLRLNIDYKDAKNDSQARAELLEHGGKIQVPCLKTIDVDGKVSWMYESADIEAHLKERFAA